MLRTPFKNRFFFFFSNKNIFEGTLCLVISSHLPQLREDEGAVMPSVVLDTVFIGFDCLVWQQC